MPNFSPQASPPLCPLCHVDMVWRDVSPCMECGADPRELKMPHNEAHSYNEVLVFGQFPLILCDFCQIDFGTYPSYFFGVPRRQHLGFNDLEFLRKVKPVLSQDWVCPQCGYRHGFLQFVATVRAHFKDAGQCDA